MRSTWSVAFAVVLFVAGVSGAAPGFAQDGAARIAEEKARRVKRRALEKELVAKEEALDAAREGGNPEAIATAEADVKSVAMALAIEVARLAAGDAPVRPKVPGAPLGPVVPYRPAEGLRPLRIRPENRGAAVHEAALDWLARHQSATGSWDSDGFDACCKDGRCPGSGGSTFDTGLSGLATLAFLRAGETHKTVRFGNAVRNGLKYLKEIQDAEGCFGPRISNHFTYNHAIATIAMAEAYGATGSPLFKASAQNGVNFVFQCQNPYLAWRYGVRPQDNDTTVTGWMVMALASAKAAGLDVPRESFTGALAWLDLVTEPEFGRAGYTARGNGPARPQELMDRFPADQSESLTASGILSRLHCGAPKDDPMVRKGAVLCLKTPPRWDDAEGYVDFYYWYLGTEAMWRMDDASWKSWSVPMRESLGAHQRGEADGCARGSWDPVDPWGPDGGRIYSTALNAMSAEMVYGARPRPAEGPK